MRLALTGATGFVGAAVVDAALARGWQVAALARRPQPPRAGVAWIAGALDDAAALARLAEGADAFLHIAGVVKAADPRAFIAGNVTGTAHALAAAGATRCRFVHVSSLAARAPQLSAYGASKAQAEALVRKAEIAASIVRPPWVYGPGDRDTLDMFRAARFGLVPVPGVAGARTALIHVADLARLLLAMAAAPAAEGALYEADDGRTGGWAYAEIVALLGVAVGRRAVPLPLPAWAMRAAARADRWARGARAKLTADRVGYMLYADWTADSTLRPPADLWRPAIGLDRGFVDTARAYRTAGWLGPKGRHIP